MSNPTVIEKDNPDNTNLPIKIYKNATEVWQEHEASSCKTVIYRNQVFDITDFVAKLKHPGGNNVFEEFYGKDLTLKMHERNHSKTAYRILQKFKIGEITEKVTYSIDEPVESVAPVKKKTFFITDEMAAAIDKKINLRKPLYPQILNNNLTREEYLAFIMEPKILEEPLRVRVFQSDRFERMTHGNWYAMVSKWLPVLVLLFSYHFFYVVNYPIWKVLMLICVGIFDWTLSEYLLHRFVFHFNKNYLTTRWSRGIHFLIHGIHHAFPLEPGRLGFPIILIGPIILIKTTQFFTIFGYNSGMFGFIGFFIGYIGYDLFHYYCHHSPWTQFENLRKYHMNHHFKNPDQGYGVTTKLWDYVFGTQLTE